MKGEMMDMMYALGLASLLQSLAPRPLQDAFTASRACCALLSPICFSTDTTPLSKCIAVRYGPNSRISSRALSCTSGDSVDRLPASRLTAALGGGGTPGRIAGALAFMLTGGGGAGDLEGPSTGGAPGRGCSRRCFPACAMSTALTLRICCGVFCSCPATWPTTCSASSTVSAASADHARSSSMLASGQPSILASCSSRCATAGATWVACGLSVRSSSLPSWE
mmetsp:Transcript_37343/g.93750  ORF Transcript_37343/g.93750 Transcript_37343/m.93750 type:complete len:223 (+) Transcript_37343:328-996(+)